MRNRSKLGRREVLLAGGLAALTRSCGGTPKGAPPGPLAAPGNADAGAPAALEVRATLESVLDKAISVARKAGASYVDARIVRRRSERVATREDHVVAIDAGESYGVGVRVIVEGAWGFAASARVVGEAAEGAARRAVEIARAARKFQKKPVELARAEVLTGSWSTDLRIDPFEVPLADKAAFLLELWPRVRDVPLVKFATGAVEIMGEWKLFASSEGSLLEQTITRIHPSFTVTAVENGKFASRSAEVAPMQAGWEYVTEGRLIAMAKETGEDAAAKLKAPGVKPGKRDLILAPSNLWLTIHESVGHPTELDRALGLEANFAGTSFATPDKLGKLKYGADIVTLYADKTTPGALATCAWDDDGVKTQKWDLVKDGLFVGYQTTRDQAGWIGEASSRGTSYAEDWSSVPFQRMPNVSLAPRQPRAGAGDTRLEDIIAQTDDGVLITGNGSWSIDHQRYNFQFSGQMFHEVKKGKVTGPLRDVAYQSNSLEFWSSCDMIGGPSTWQLNGTLHDGKGEPPQSNAVSHGCPPARFRGVQILNTGGGGRPGLSREEEEDMG